MKTRTREGFYEIVVQLLVGLPSSAKRLSWSNPSPEPVVLALLYDSRSHLSTLASASEQSGLASVVVIVLGLKLIKDNNGGFLSLGEALKNGLGISLISGVVYVVYFYVFVNFIQPDYFTNLASFQEASMIEMYPNMTDDQLENAIEMSKKFSGFGMISAIIMIMSLFFGFVISMIAGLIMKKTQEEE